MSSRLFREAWESLARHKLRTFFMALSVLIGVGALTAVVCLGEGTRAEILSRVAKHGLDMLMVRPGEVKPGDAKPVFAQKSGSSVATLVEADAEAILAGVPNVVSVACVQNQRGLETTREGKSVQTRVFGVSPEWVEIRRRPMARGSFVDGQDMVHQAKVCVLGANTARALFGDQDPVGQEVRIGGDPFRVKGLFAEIGAAASAGEDWDDRIVIPFTTSSRRLFKRPHLEQVVIRVRDVNLIPQTAEKIRGLLRSRHGADDFFVREPKDVKEAALATSDTLTRVLSGIAAVALLAGGIVIMNIMLLSVSQRVHEIGLRRAVGARRADIAGQFLLETLSISLLGGILGVGAGLAFAAARASAGAHARITWLPFAVAAGSCIGVAVVFGLVPALRASRVDPVVALRQKGV